MKIFKFILVWCSGIICGIVFIFILQNSNPENIEITVINNSSSVIKELWIAETGSKNSGHFKNVRPNDIINFSLIVIGEMTYQISAKIDSTDTLETEVYSEPGNKDYFIVLNDSIIYKPKVNC